MRKRSSGFPPFQRRDGWCEARRIFREAVFELWIRALCKGSTVSSVIGNRHNHCVVREQRFALNSGGNADFFALNADTFSAFGAIFYSFDGRKFYELETFEAVEQKRKISR
jgi:hypothetical protein